MNQNSPISMQIHFRHSCLFIILLCIVALGPYILPTMGLRLEHFVIYGSFLYVIFKMLLCINAKMDRNVFLLMLLCLANVFWMVVVSLQNISWASPYRIFAALENFTQPVALIIIIYATMTRLDRAARQNLLQVASIAVIVMLCINSVIAILTIFYDTWPFTQYFVVADYGTEGEMATVWERAASMGRFLGIFNQPGEAGLAYSIGSLVWVYLATTSKRINSIAWVSLILLIIGGSLSVSKSFILGGFPLSMLYWFWTAISQKRIRKSTLIGGMGWFLGGVAVISLFAKSWAGLGFLLRLFDWSYIKDEGAIYIFTGQRYGGDESVINQLARIWSETPVMGFGVPLRYISALDSAYYEFFIYGGIVGLIFYIAILAVILWVAFRGLRTDSELGRLLMALWILIIGAGIGAGVLTINRSSIFLLVILVITFGVLSKRRASDISRNAPKSA